MQTIRVGRGGFSGAAQPVELAGAGEKEPLPAMAGFDSAASIKHYHI